MNKIFGLDTLMAIKGLTSNEAFQVYYNDILASREGEGLNLSGFERWDIPQVDFTYEQLELENDIKVMATFRDRRLASSSVRTTTVSR